MYDLISRQQAIVAIEQHKTAVLEGHKWDEGIEYGYAAAHRHIVDIVEQLPSAQPERKTVFNRDIAIEAICDEVMLWFDISATQAYEIAETAVKRIEVRMEKTNRGEKE